MFWLQLLFRIISLNCFSFFHLCTEMSVSTQTGCFVNIHFTKIETIHYIFYDALSYSYHPETKGVSHELVDSCQAQGLLVYVWLWSAVCFSSVYLMTGWSAWYPLYLLERCNHHTKRGVSQSNWRYDMSILFFHFYRLSTASTGWNIKAANSGIICITQRVWIIKFSCR